MRLNKLHQHHRHHIAGRPNDAQVQLRYHWPQSGPFIHPFIHSFGPFSVVDFWPSLYPLWMLWLTTKPVQGNNYDFSSAPTHTIPNWLRFLPRFRCGGRVQPFNQIVNLSPGLEHAGYTYMPGDKINYGQRQREVRVGRRLEQKGDTLNDLPLVGPSKQHSLADHKYVRTLPGCG